MKLISRTYAADAGDAVGAGIFGAAPMPPLPGPPCPRPPLPSL